MVIKQPTQSILTNGGNYPIPTFKLCLLALLTLTFAPLQAHANALPRPVVLVFAGSINPTGGGVGAHKEGGDGLSVSDRTRAGMLAVMSCLGDSGAFVAFRYDPMNSSVIRALAESKPKIEIAHPDDPTPEERLLIAKAMGAVYEVAVSTQTPAEAPAGTLAISMTIDGADVATQKKYTDHIQMSANAVPMRLPSVPDGDDRNALRHFSGNDQLDNVLQSAANTLVLRLLGDPLREFSRAAAPPNLLPPTQSPVKPSPDVVRPKLPETSLQTNVSNTPPATLALPTNDNEETTTFSQKTVRSVPGKITLPAPGTGSEVYAAAGRTYATADEEANAAIQQSSALLSDGDPSAAITMLRQAIDRQPLSPDLRLALSKAYLSVHRDEDAESEARRALIVLPALAPVSLANLTAVLTKSVAESGDAAHARAVYLQIVTDHPEFTWAHNALAGSYESEGQPEDAEAEYQKVLKVDATNVVAASGLARMRISHGDLPGTQAILAAFGQDKAGMSARYDVIIAVFDAGTTAIADRVAKNRAAWEAKSLSNEAIFTATNSQFERINALVALIKSTTPAAAGRPDTDAQNYKVRIAAAYVLAQAANAMVRLIQTGDADAGSETTLQLNEFQQQLAKAQGK